jgi:hypothetical protein
MKKIVFSGLLLLLLAGCAGLVNNQPTGLNVIVYQFPT